LAVTRATNAAVTPGTTGATTGGIAANAACAASPARAGVGAGVDRCEAITTVTAPAAVGTRAVLAGCSPATADADRASIAAGTANFAGIVAAGSVRAIAAGPARPGVTSRAARAAGGITTRTAGATRTAGGGARPTFAVEPGSAYAAVEPGSAYAAVTAGAAGAATRGIAAPAAATAFATGETGGEGGIPVAAVTATTAISTRAILAGAAVKTTGSPEAYRTRITTVTAGTGARC